MQNGWFRGYILRIEYMYSNVCQNFVWYILRQCTAVQYPSLVDPLGQLENADNEKQ